MESELEEYRDAWRERRWKLEQNRIDLSAKAFLQAGVLAEKLKKDYHCEAVYLIGSLARREFQEDSDIDLVVKGLKAADFYRAMGELLALSKFPVDLIPLEDANELMRKQVECEGKQL